jgi:hypothetical protein
MRMPTISLGKSERRAKTKNWIATLAAKARGSY